MSAENRNFTSMNTEVQLQLSNIRIAQLLDELSELRKHSGASHEAELREQYSRERESDRAFYRDQLACMEERHKQELEALKESYQEHAEELKRNYKESNAQLKRQLQSMSAQISTLQNSLNTSSLSEAELKALDRFHRSQRFKRSSEQTRLLKNKKEVSRSQEKDDFDGDGSSESAQDAPAQHHSSPVKNKSGKGTNTRVDYDKNKPYTSNPLYHKLGEYFTMPSGGKYVMRGGAIDTWWYRVLKRIPEHYEEHFYEVARVRLANGERFNTKSGRLIPGCPFDRELVTFVLTEHFCYNTPYLQIVTMLKDRALEISDSTLGNIVHKIIAYFRGEMAESWEKEIRKADYWMMDETPGMVGCIKEGTKSYLNRYFWGIKAKAMKLVWFLYENGSRGLKAIKPYLDQFIGFFTTDGYVVYKVYEKEDHPLQTRSACLTHIRRYFVDALEENRERAMWFIEEFGKLFAIEYECKRRRLTPEERLKERLRRSRHIMITIETRLEDFFRQGYKDCGELMKKALGYARSEWQAMKSVLKNGVVELSNNLAEQMMRHIKMNLKNCLNIGSERSAVDTAFMYSLVESCRANNISPVRYIRFLVDKLSDKTVDRTTLLPCYCGL